MSCIKEVKRNFELPCKSPQDGIQEGILLNFNEITGVTFVSGFTTAVADIALSSSGGFVVDSAKNASIIFRDNAEEGTFFNANTAEADINVFSESVEDVENINSMNGARLVMILKTTSSGSGRYRIIGLDAGAFVVSVAKDSSNPENPHYLITLRADDESTLAKHLAVYNGGVYDAAATEAVYESLKRA